MRAAGPAIVAALSTVLACGDAAVDSRYQGEPLFELEVALDRRGVTDPKTLRFAVRWAAEGANADVVVDAPVVRGEATRYFIALYEEPPASVLRAADEGTYAVGQVLAYADVDGDRSFAAADSQLAASYTLIGFAPGSARGVALVDGLAPGFQLIWTSAPCDGPDLMFFAADHAAEPVVFMSDRSGQLTSFSDPGCPEAVAVARGGCPVLTTVRWVCRHGPATPALCDLCEHLLFPEGAGPEVCDPWLARCVNSDSDAECRREWRVCLAGEPVREAPCDLGCACDKQEALCLAEGGQSDACAIKRDNCLWWRGPG